MTVGAAQSATAADQQQAEETTKPCRYLNPLPPNFQMGMRAPEGSNVMVCGEERSVFDLSRYFFKTHVDLLVNLGGGGTYSTDGTNGRISRNGVCFAQQAELHLRMRTSVTDTGYYVSGTYPRHGLDHSVIAGIGHDNEVRNWIAYQPEIPLPFLMGLLRVAPAVGLSFDSEAVADETLNSEDAVDAHVGLRVIAYVPAVLFGMDGAKGFMLTGGVQSNNIGRSIASGVWPDPTVVVMLGIPLSGEF